MQRMFGRNSPTGTRRRGSDSSHLPLSAPQGATRRRRIRAGVDRGVAALGSGIAAVARTVRRRRLVSAVVLLVVIGLACVGATMFRQARTHNGAFDHPYLALEVKDEWKHFDAPDFGLNQGPFPHEVRCDKSGKLIFMGIFSTMEKKQRRDLFRNHILGDYAKAGNVEIKFIVAEPNLARYPKDEHNKRRRQLEKQVAAENKQHNDILILPTVDNIDSGKTFEYFKYMAKHYAAKPPQFVMKVDDDAIWSAPNLLSAFSELDCNQATYWGSSAGGWTGVRPYFRGMGYAVSWPLVGYLARTTYQNTLSVEDVRVSELLWQLDPVTDPVRRVDMGHNMADWNQVNTTLNTVCLHWLKDDEWVILNHHRLLSTWAAHEREYKIGNGLPLAELIESGKTHVPPSECYGWFHDYCLETKRRLAEEKRKRAIEDMRMAARLRGTTVNGTVDGLNTNEAELWEEDAAWDEEDAAEDGDDGAWDEDAEEADEGDEAEEAGEAEGVDRSVPTGAGAGPEAGSASVLGAGLPSGSGPGESHGAAGGEQDGA